MPIDKPQRESKIEAVRNFETKMDELHAELRKADVTKEKLADLLPNRQDFLIRWQRLVSANKTLLKAKYQPEWMDSKSGSFCRYLDELDSLETRHKTIGQMLTMMRIFKNERQLKEFLHLQNSKENCDEMIEKTKMKSKRIEMSFAIQRITKPCKKRKKKLLKEELNLWLERRRC